MSSEWQSISVSQFCFDEWAWLTVEGRGCSLHQFPRLIGCQLSFTQQAGGGPLRVFQRVLYGTRQQRRHKQEEDEGPAASWNAGGKLWLADCYRELLPFVIWLCGSLTLFVMLHTAERSLNLTWAHGGQHHHDVSPNTCWQSHPERRQAAHRHRGVDAEPQRQVLQEQSHGSVKRRQQESKKKRCEAPPRLHQVSSNISPLVEVSPSRWPETETPIQTWGLCGAPYRLGFFITTGKQCVHSAHKYT